MARGGYTFDQIKQMDNLELSFVDHYQELQESKFLDRLGFILGVNWDPEQIQALAAAPSGGAGGGESAAGIFIPLSVAINPQIVEYIKKNAGRVGSQSNYIAGGEYAPAANEQVRSTSELSKDEFLALLGKKKRD